MSTKEKLINRFCSIPSDFTFDELTVLLAYFGFALTNKGKTSGSRAMFINDRDTIILHKPHPGNTVKIYVLKQIREFLERKGYI